MKARPALASLAPTDVVVRLEEERPAPAVGVRRRIGVLVVALDTVLLVAAILLAHLVRFGPVWPARGEWLVVAVAVPVWLVAAAAWRLHHFHRFTPLEDVRRLVGAISLAIVLVWTVSFWSQAVVSRGWVGLSWAFALAAVLAHRAAWRAWLARETAAGRLRLRTLIVGTTAEGERLAEVLARSSEFEPVGFVWTGAGDPRLDGLPRVADLAHVAEAAGRVGADCLFVAPSAVTEEQMLHLVRASRQSGLELRVAANLPAVLTTRVALQPLDRAGSVMSLALHPIRLTGPQAALKRAFDVVGAALGLVIGSPLFAAIALAVKLDSPGPILYRQTRVGRFGRQFEILKFRTMHQSNSGDLHGVLEDPARRLEWETRRKLADDPRVTRVGRVLRRWSLDELPQLVNVLRGEMSLVGPRPVVPEELECLGDLRELILQVRPGLAGLWAASGRSEIPYPRRAHLEASYVLNWGLILDMSIMARTALAVFQRRGAL
jgi:exopolysaccharide biosynthesis polyprenyl glycosylphosphotransferase